ncbi:hypothetical protein R1sor_001891 [Riccia sorocarpa]|uniref:Uncharacterized protein n=1 Tax=Riccia sorocarpa TaxID=122646 RepID=A0ABD3H354_9MARC
MEKGDSLLSDMESKRLYVLASVSGSSHEKAKELIIYRHAVGHEARPLKQDCLEPEVTWITRRGPQHTQTTEAIYWSAASGYSGCDERIREAVEKTFRPSHNPTAVLVLPHFHYHPYTCIGIEISMLGGSPAIEFHTPHMKFIYQKLSNFWVTSMVSFPLTVSMDCLAKASVVYTVASTYAGLKVTFGDILHPVLPRVWVPLSVTYTFCCVLFLAWRVVVILGLGFLNGVLLEECKWLPGHIFSLENFDRRPESSAEFAFVSVVTN